MIPIGDDNPTHGPSWITWGLILTNALVFLLGLRLNPAQQFELHIHRGFIPARLTQLIGMDQRLAVEIPVKQVERFGPFLVQLPRVLVLPVERREIMTSLVTCMFLHGGWTHLLGNMLFLFIFGNNLEDRLGPLRYLLFYLLGGLVATLCHWLTDTHSVVPTIGASGAVAAVLGAYIVTWPQARVRVLLPLGFLLLPMEFSAFFVLGFWFVGQLLEATRLWGLEMGGGVAFFAHIGGFVFGAAWLAARNRWFAEKQSLRLINESVSS